MTLKIDRNLSWVGVEHLSIVDGKICQCTDGKSGQTDAEEFIPVLKGENTE